MQHLVHEKKDFPCDYQYFLRNSHIFAFNNYHEKLLYMKKLIYLFVLAVLAGSISSCKQENRPQIVNGIVYDATMNNITLITGKGDTINISTMDANPDKVPGVLLEDSEEVTCIKEKIEGGEILKATELVIIKK